MKTTTPRERTRARLRAALSRYPTGVYPASTDEPIDELIEAVCARPEVIMIYAVLITRDGRIEGADLFEDAHPEALRERGYDTAPLFSCSMAVPEMSDLEANVAKDPTAIVAYHQEQIEYAYVQVCRKAVDQLQEDRYNWVGAISYEHARRAALGHPPRELRDGEPVTFLRDNRAEGWASLRTHAPHPTALRFEIPRPLVDALTKLRDAKYQGTDHVHRTSEHVLGVWQQLKLDRQADKERRFHERMFANRLGPEGLSAMVKAQNEARDWFEAGASWAVAGERGPSPDRYVSRDAVFAEVWDRHLSLFGAERFGAQPQDQWAEVGQMWAELIKGPTPNGLVCVKVPHNCRVVDPSWPHGMPAEQTEINATPVHALESAASVFMRTAGPPSDPQWPITAEDRAQARAALQLAALDLALMILTRCLPQTDQCDRDGWLQAVEVLRRFQRRADQDANPNSQPPESR